MNTNDGKGRRIDLLRKAVDTVPNVSATTIYCFSDKCAQVHGVRGILEPQSGTALDNAFNVIRAAGFERAVLITDGMPDDEERSLSAAAGLTLRIIYVGPKPVPDFLKRLAQLARGEWVSHELTETKLLGREIAGYLTKK